MATKIPETENPRLRARLEEVESTWDDAKRAETEKIHKNADGSVAYVHIHATVDPRAVVRAPAVVCAHAEVQALAVVRSCALIGERAVVGSFALVGGGAEVRDGARVGEGAVVRSGAILCDGAVVGGHAVVREGAVIHAGAVVCVGAVVLRNAVVGTGAVVGWGAVVPARGWIPPGAHVEGELPHATLSSKRTAVLVGGVVTVEDRVHSPQEWRERWQSFAREYEITPEECGALLSFLDNIQEGKQRQE